MLDAKRLCLGHDAQEDRLWIVMSDDHGHRFTGWITRKLIARLMDALASSVESSTPYRSRLPANQTKAFLMDILAMEHQVAIQAITGRPPAVLDQPALDPAHQGPHNRTEAELITTIHVDNPDDRLRLVFLTAEGERSALSMNRCELHRMLAGLVRLADKADWQLPRPRWMARWRADRTEAIFPETPIILH